MSEQPVRLYELVIANGRSASPYVWRIRYALAHKGIRFESIPVGFTDIPKILEGRFKTVPIIEHAGTAMAESWDIADYLERSFPSGTPLFSSAAERAMVKLMDTWFMAEVVRKLFRLYVLDVYNAARPQDKAYFRQTREARIHGTTLEAFTANRIELLPALRESLAPLRARLSVEPFLGGATPNYADYIALGAFQWVSSIATLPPLDPSDQPLLRWLERGFDLYGGMGRDSRQRPLS